MNSVICLALSCLLIGLLYVYMRQQFAAHNRRITELTELVASVAVELQQPVKAPPPPPLEVKRLPERVTVSDDSESESDTDDESVSDTESEPDAVETVVETVVTKEKEKEIEIEPLENSIEIEDFSILLDISDATKTINLFEAPEAPKKVNYDKMTVKELKDLATKEGGPAGLKTKKDLIEFLEKKK